MVQFDPAGMLQPFWVQGADVMFMVFVSSLLEPDPA